METEKTAEKKKTEGPSKKQLREQLAELTEEFRFLSTEASSGNSAALQRRSELAKQLRAISETLYLREPDVEVQVPRSVTGHPFRIGEHDFLPGRHVVKASTAQMLLWMIYKNREDELNRLRQNGETVDLGAIGDKAHMSERVL